MNISSNPGIYIHFPFCKSKCGYCDFFSVTDLTAKSDFINFLSKEIKLKSMIYKAQTEFDTIYLGGGTPSLFSASEINLILENIHRFFPISNNAEITIEVNPGTMDHNKMLDYITSGINRINIGIQSFDDKILAILQRLHSREDALSSLHNAREAGFNNIGIDLIYAIPGQSPDSWLESLETGLQFEPEHIAAYNLTFEDGTPFSTCLENGELEKYSDTKESLFFNVTHDIMTKKGYRHYEVSNYALNVEYISRHNYKYWNHVPILSFGPSAHSFWDQKRFSNISNIGLYMNQLKNGIIPVDIEEELTEKDLMFEHIFLGLRTYDGINITDFENKYNVNFVNIYSDKIDNLIQHGYAFLDKDNLRLSEKGMLICDEIIAGFSYE